ncbi:hypothetical protein M0R72_02625 [Candidatus Pacearchaeota archaeon]|jgi:hypothetical protein|nr:hypothetical protein [Candidatus Pacearchaeota archaeon]
MSIEVPDTLIAKNGGAFAVAEQTIANWLKNTTTIVSCAASPAPIDGYVLTATSSTTAAWKPSSGIGPINTVYWSDGYNDIWSSDPLINTVNAISWVETPAVYSESDLILGCNGDGGNIDIHSGGGTTSGIISLSAASYNVVTMGRSDIHNFNGSKWMNFDGYFILPSQTSVMTSSYATEQMVADHLVTTNANGYGSYAISPIAYDGGTYQVPRTDKFFGTFKLVGTAPTYSVQIPTTIHSAGMPRNSVLLGRIRVGWNGNGSYTNGGAIEFLYTITSDGGGKVKMFCCSISDNTVLAGGSSPVSSVGKPVPINGDCDYVLPTGSNMPLIVVDLPSSDRYYTFIFRATDNPLPTDTTNFVYDIEHTWGET